MRRAATTAKRAARSRPRACSSPGPERTASAPLPGRRRSGPAEMSQNAQQTAFGSYAGPGRYVETLGQPSWFGHYRLTSRIATGGMAEVYVGRHITPDGNFGPM